MLSVREHITQYVQNRTQVLLSKDQKYETAKKESRRGFGSKRVGFLKEKLGELQANMEKLPNSDKTEIMTQKNYLNKVMKSYQDEILYEDNRKSTREEMERVLELALKACDL